MSLALPSLPRRLWASPGPGEVVAQEAWGRLERVAEGVWALVSTPLTGDRTTLCNGGIVAGRSGTLMIEAFASDRGAQWMAEQAKALTGRTPTHLLVTHYHSDHAAGLRGVGPSPDIALFTTAVTRDLVLERNQNAPRELYSAARLLDATKPTVIDLGRRRATVTPSTGHTLSDVSVRIDDPDVVFCGDLVWNGMFPNYVDAIPSRLSGAVRALQKQRAATYIPGHGSIATPAELATYVALLDDVEQAARRARERGITAEAAGAEYRLPAASSGWTLFNQRYFERAIGAWMTELAAAR